MGQITVDQSQQVVATLIANVSWEEIDFERAGLQNSVIRNPKEAGRQFTSFLLNGGRMIFGEQIIKLNRDQPFDPINLLGQGWTIDEQDERSLILTQIDLSKIQLVNMLKKGEDRIGGIEEFARLKGAGHVCLDAKVFQTLWEDQSLIPGSWKQTFIFFYGTILRDPDGIRRVLYLYWRNGRWRWDYHWLESSWNAYHPSAVLASIRA